MSHPPRTQATSAGDKEASSTADKLLWVNIMWNNGHDAYLESRVLSADPIELVNMLYQGCMQAVREARLHLAEGRIAERSREITKACQIVIELAVSLDHERGGEISRRLALLYDYMHRRLLEANMRQSDEPLADVLGLLSTLSEGWEGIRTPESQPVAESAPAPQPSTESAWSSNPRRKVSGRSPDPERLVVPAGRRQCMVAAVDAEPPGPQPVTENAASAVAAGHAERLVATRDRERLVTAGNRKRLVATRGGQPLAVRARHGQPLGAAAGGQPMGPTPASGRRLSLAGVQFLKGGLAAAPHHSLQARPILFVED